jgi:hypothetical protein
MEDVIILVAVVVVQLAVALICGHIAHSRGHSFWIWTAISAIIVPSILSLPIVLVYCRRDNIDRIP